MNKYMSFSDLGQHGVIKEKRGDVEFLLVYNNEGHNSYNNAIYTFRFYTMGEISNLGNWSFLCAEKYNNKKDYIKMINNYQPNQITSLFQELIELYYKHIETLNN